MWLDGVPIPEQVRPWIGWAVGMDWPEADEAVLFRLADDLALAFHRINGGVRGDGTLAGGAAAGIERDDWDGKALRQFMERVGGETAGRKEKLLSRLAGMALACNDLGVQVQYTKRMIKASVLLLIVQLLWLLWAILSPSSGVAWAAAGVRARATRMTIRQLAKRLLFNVALFGILMGGMDLYVQATQSRRDEIDWDQVGWSALSGALTGAVLTGSTGLLPPRSVLGLMGHSAGAGGVATLATMLLSGQPIDWEMVAKGTTAGALGGADAHWASWNPRAGRHADPGPTSVHDPAATPGRSPHEPLGSGDPPARRPEPAGPKHDFASADGGHDSFSGVGRRKGDAPGPETTLAGAGREAVPEEGHKPARPHESQPNETASASQLPPVRQTATPTAPGRSSPDAPPHGGTERPGRPENSHRPEPAVRRSGGQAIHSRDNPTVARDPRLDFALPSQDGVAGPGTRSATPTHATSGPDTTPVSGWDRSGEPGSSGNRIDQLINRPADQPAVTVHHGDPHGGHHGPGSPTAVKIPPHPGHRPMPPGLLEAVHQLGEGDGSKLGGGISAREIFSFWYDGSEYVYKAVKHPREADAEVLGSILGERIGAKVPPVYRVDATTIVMPFVGTGTTLLGLRPPTNLAAKLLGLLHVLDVDADANLRNIVLDENGDPWGIDMSGAFGKLPAELRGKIAEMTNSPFADYWVSRKRQGLIVLDFTYIRNELSRADVEWLATQIRSARPYFEGLGHPDWFDAVWSRFLKIAENASGSTSIFGQE